MRIRRKKIDREAIFAAFAIDQTLGTTHDVIYIGDLLYESRIDFDKTKIGLKG